MEEAPLYTDIAEGPEGGQAFWTRADDGVRLRLGHWPGGVKGTVLLFPGRTEYIEKYGPTARDLLARGYGTLSIDWRCQGLSDRLTDDPMLGHVDRFSDFQRDVAAVVQVAEDLNCPKPWFLIAHSMGGCIGLRALHRGLDVRAVAFTGPMWGMQMAPALRPLARPLSRLMTMFGAGQAYAPTTKGETYVKAAPFQDNMLTSDPDMYAFMQRQATAHPELTLSGPSVSWLDSALQETCELQAMPAPDIPALTFLGTNERIVEIEPIHRIMGKWKQGRLEMAPGCEHEILMEGPAMRATFFDAVETLFAGA